MEGEKLLPIDFKTFIPTELRIQGIRQYIYDILGGQIEERDFKFKKSDFSFIRKRGKSFEKIMFLFYSKAEIHYQY